MPLCLLRVVISSAAICRVVERTGDVAQILCMGVHDGHSQHEQSRCCSHQHFSNQPTAKTNIPQIKAKQGGPLIVISGVITPISRVITPFTHL